MYVFIDFWKLETENSLLHVFSFLHKLNFENSFCFLSILSCQTSFLILKIENCFWKHKIRGKNSYQTYLVSITWKHLKCVFSFHNLLLKNSENWVMEIKTENKSKQTKQSWDPPILSYGWWKQSYVWWKTTNPNNSLTSQLYFRDQACGASMDSNRDQRKPT